MATTTPSWCRARAPLRWAVPGRREGRSPPDPCRQPRLPRSGRCPWCWASGTAIGPPCATPMRPSSATIDPVASLDAPRSELGGQMKQSHPSNVSSDVEPPPTALPDVDAAPPRQPDSDGAEGYVLDAFEAYGAEVFAFLARSTRDRPLAEDLLHEVFRRLAKEARDGRPPLDVRAWLYRTASTAVIEHPRRRTRAPRWLSGGGRTHGEDTTGPSQAGRGSSSERVTEMDRVLEGLSPDARLALLLSAEGFTGEEVAIAVGRSVAATRTLLGLARARVRVRRELFAEEAR